MYCDRCVTVCNWNQGSETCEFCALELIHCIRMLSNSTTSDCEPFTRYANFTSSRNTDYFRCVQFNYDKDNVQMSEEVGYGSSISMLFGVPHLQVNYNVTKNTATRKNSASDLALVLAEGVQITFHLNTDQPNVFEEYNFSPTGVNTFFMLTKTIETKLLRNGQSTTTIYWKVKPSTIQLPAQLDRLSTSTEKYVAISVAYETLSTFILTDQVTYLTPNFLGDLAGMTGTMLGMDMIKLFRALLAIPLSLYELSLQPLYHVLTG